MQFTGKRIATAIFIAAAVLVAASSLLMPSLCRSTESANRMKCANNLRQIGLAIKTYCQQNAGQYPPDFAVLLRSQDITSDSFVCPSSNDDRVEDSAAKSHAELARLMQPGFRCCSYFHCSVSAWSEQTVSAEHVVAYERNVNHDEDGINILFADGHVDWIDRRDVTKVIAELQAGQNPPPSLK